MHPGAHLRHIGRPVSLQISVEEGIGVGIQADEFHLPSDHSAEHLSELRILACQSHVRVDLSSRVSQPHRSNVTSVDKGIRLSLLIVTEVYRRVERIGEAIPHHPPQLRIRQPGLCLPDHSLHSVRAEESLLHGRTLADVPCSILLRGHGDRLVVVDGLLGDRRDCGAEQHQCRDDKALLHGLLQLDVVPIDQSWLNHDRLGGSVSDHLEDHLRSPLVAGRCGSLLRCDDVGIVGK